MSYLRFLLIPIVAFLLLTACEEEFVPDVVVDPSQIVVEGYIEAGERRTPPYIFLTRSLGFFSELSTDELENAYVHDAVITVTDGSETVRLREFCSDDIDPATRDFASVFLGVNVDSLPFDLCVYTDPTLSMLGQAGRTYDLRIEVEGATYTARTTIPEHIPLSDLRFVDPPGAPIDTLLELRVTLDDPADNQDYYRYFTAVNNSGFIAPDASVVDDRLFNGQEFNFPLVRAPLSNEEFDLATFGLYRRGTTARIKWMCLDEGQFNFWNTLEFTVANQGPFSSYTRIDSNIEGGALGIWGGFSASYYNLRVPE
jgi:hypothetical protein